MDVTQTLYGWYLANWERDEAIAKPARAALNYQPSEVFDNPIDLAEFVRWLRFPSHNPSVKQTWLNGFTYGHDAEVAKFPPSAQRFLRDCVNHAPSFLDGAPKEMREAS
jgi:hypothetical protein